MWNVRKNLPPSPTPERVKLYISLYTNPQSTSYNTTSELLTDFKHLESRSGINPKWRTISTCQINANEENPLFSRERLRVIQSKSLGCVIAYATQSRRQAVLPYKPRFEHQQLWGCHPIWTSTRFLLYSQTAVKSSSNIHIAINAKSRFL